MEENASPIRNLPLLKSKMFPSPGRPARIVCCFREPAGTINSHLKKFPHHILEDEDRFFDAARPLYYKPIFHTSTDPECRLGVFYHREKLFGKLSRSCARFPALLTKESDLLRAIVEESREIACHAIDTLNKV